jgi:hypothetical protein
LVIAGLLVGAFEVLLAVEALDFGFDFVTAFFDAAFMTLDFFDVFKSGTLNFAVRFLGPMVVVGWLRRV